MKMDTIVLRHQFVDAGCYSFLSGMDNAEIGLYEPYPLAVVLFAAAFRATFVVLDEVVKSGQLAITIKRVPLVGNS